MLPLIRMSILVAAMVLAGCEWSGPQNREAAPHQTAAPAPAPQQVFRSDRYGVELAYPENGVQGSNGTTGYFGDHGWRADAGANAQGRRLLALRLDGSDDVTAGELRLGVSRNPAALRACTRPGNLAAIRDTGETTLDGVVFTTYQGGEAGMSHYRNVHAYRAVHNGICYAIDLVVQGTRPQVYDPPRTPPFSQQQAFRRLQGLLTGLAFTDAPR